MAQCKTQHSGRRSHLQCGRSAMAKKAKKTASKTATTSTGASTPYSGSKPNNWHRKMYTLDKKAGDPPEYKEVVNETYGATNEFWLEAAVYTGPEMDVVAIHV